MPPECEKNQPICFFTYKMGANDTSLAQAEFLPRDTELPKERCWNQTKIATKFTENKTNSQDISMKVFFFFKYRLKRDC